MKKVLLLGSSGMAGQVLKVELSKLKSLVDLIDISRSNIISEPSITLDVTNFLILEQIIIENNFDYIINCIGILNSNAEVNYDQAILINSYFPHYLEKITSQLKTKIIHISTDCVFSGKDGGYVESDFKDGIGYYAQSKALGEIINNKDLTIRTSIIGPDLNKNGIGLFNWIIRQKGQISGYKNVFWSGVTTIELTKCIVDIILGERSLVGLVHLTNNKKINKYELLALMKKVFQLNSLEIVENFDYCVDKSFINTRDDFNYIVPSYMEMIIEMKSWIEFNKRKLY